MSPEGIALLKKFEGCRLRAYRDVGGILTIGYGHTGAVREGDVISADFAEKLLRADIANFERKVKDCTIGISLSQNQFEALTSFAFNVGIGALAKSTLLHRLKEGDKLGAALEFLRWDRAGGKVVAGLTKRREAEMTLFTKVDY